jgi:hypothetical protein
MMQQTVEGEGEILAPKNGDLQIEEKSRKEDTMFPEVVWVGHRAGNSIPYKVIVGNFQRGNTGRNTWQ